MSTPTRDEARQVRQPHACPRMGAVRPGTSLQARRSFIGGAVGATWHRTTIHPPPRPPSIKIAFVAKFLIHNFRNLFYAFLTIFPVAGILAF